MFDFYKSTCITIVFFLLNIHAQVIVSSLKVNISRWSRIYDPNFFDPDNLNKNKSLF